MIILELPVLYCQNYHEVEESNSSGIPVPEIHVTEKTLFIINTELFDVIKLNPNGKNRSTLCISEDSHTIELDYESVRLILKEAIKQERT